MRIQSKAYLGLAAVAALLMAGCAPPPTETADSTTSSPPPSPPSAASNGGSRPSAANNPSSQQGAGQRSGPQAPSAAGMGGGAPSAAGMGGGAPSAAGMGNSGSGSAQATIPDNQGSNQQSNQQTGASNPGSRAPSAAGMGNGASANATVSENQNDSTGNQSGQGNSSQQAYNSQANRGRTTPPAGSGYGSNQRPDNANNPYANRGRTQPPEGSGYGNNSQRPAGVNNPYENRGSQGGQSSYNQGSSNQERQSGGNSSGRNAPQASSNGSGGNQQQQQSGGGAGGAVMSLDGEGPTASGGQNNSGGGAGGATMSLDEGPGTGGPGLGQPNRSQQPAGPRQVEEKSFYDMGINAFARGEDYSGLQLMQAEIATNRSRIDDLTPGLWREGKRMSLGIRMGIGVHYTVAGNFSGAPPVIGDPRPNVGGRGGRGASGVSGVSGISGPGSGSGGFGTQNNVPKDAKGFLKYYAGDLTDVLLAELEERFHGSPARYGALASLDVTPIIEVEASSERSSSNRSSRGGPGAPAGLGGGGAPTGAGGGGGPGVEGPAEGFFPGLVFLGEGSPSDLKKKAQDENLDGMFVIEHKVIVSPRTGQATADTKVDFYTVMDGKKRGYTKSLNYAMVDSDRSSGETPVEDEIEKLFEKKIDRYFTIIDMPELTEEQCAGRLDSLAQQSKDNPLPFLMEASFYVHKGWLNIDVAQEKIIKLVGEETALKIFSEDFQTQKEGLKKWLPKPKSN